MLSVYLHNKHYLTSDTSLLSYIPIEMETLPRIGELLELEGYDDIHYFRILNVVTRIGNHNFDSKIGVSKPNRVCWVNLVLDTSMTGDDFKIKVWKCN